jgi:hypothetical protein
MPEESRTESIQFCDKDSFVTPAAQNCCVKILDLRIFTPISILSSLLQSGDEKFAKAISHLPS